MRGGGRWISEFEASLAYRGSSGTVRVTQNNPVSKNNNNKASSKTAWNLTQRNPVSKNKNRKLFLIIYSCVSVCVFVYHSAGVLKGSKTVSDPLELELQTIMNHPTWMLGTELQSSVFLQQLLPLFLFLKILLAFIYVFISLPDCQYVHHVNTMPTEARRGRWIFREGSYRW